MQIDNFTITKLCIDDTLSRLYVAAKEGVLLIYDVSGKVPQFALLMKVVRSPDPKSKNYIKQMQIDASRRLLVLRMKNSDMLFMQAMNNIFQTSIVERIQLKSSEYDSITQTQWLPELACYIEGT